MMWPPSVLRLRIDNRQRHFGLWLPLFLIWPVLLVLGLVLGVILTKLFTKNRKHAARVNG